jgi:hypothetical protein
MAQSHPLCFQIEHANDPLEMMLRDGSQLKERNDHLFLGEVNPGIKINFKFGASQMGFKSQLCLLTCLLAL